MRDRFGEAAYWILTALASGRQHGYGLLREVEALSGGDVRLKIPTLYAAIDRLQVAGLVAEDGDEVVDGRRRRYVALMMDAMSVGERRPLPPVATLRFAPESSSWLI